MATQQRAAATPEKFLWQKDGARHLWFRMAVPTRYRSIEPRKIIQRDLHTSDRRQASILAGRIRADLDEDWRRRLALINGVSEPIALTVNPIEPTIMDLQIDAAQGGYECIMPKLQSLYESRNISSNQGYQEYLDCMRGHILRLVRTKDDPANLTWRRYADKRIIANNWLLPADTDLYRRYISMLAEAGIEAIRIDVERRAGSAGAQPASPVVVEGLANRDQLAPSGETIMELFELYAAQRIKAKRKRADTINQDRKVIEGFAEFVGPKRGLRSITPVDIRDWRNSLAKLPPVYRKRKENAGLSMREAAAKAEAAGLTGMSLFTVNKYMSTVSPLFAWARSENYVDHNPCDGLFHDLVKGSNSRPPFSTQQLNKILNSPLFVGFEADGKEHLTGTVKASDWRFWIPLLCLFTGARIGEIAQLRTADVDQQHGVWFVHIQEDETNGQTTKARVSRAAPIHSTLIKIGFLAYVDDQRERAAHDGDDRLFPELSPNARGQMSGTPSRFWREYLEDIGIKSGGDGFGSHSFRHTLADQLRTADYLDDQIAIAIGHHKKSVTSGYGRIQQGTVSFISKMFEAVRFEGVSFDHLMAT